MARSESNVTIYGRLSFPNFTMAEAIALNSRSTTPDKDERVAPSFSLLVEQPQFDKLMNHINTVFLPWVEARGKAGEKKSALDSKSIAKIQRVLEDFKDSQPPYVPLKEVSEKSLALMPTAVASIRIKGMAGTDTVLKAIVNDETELVVPDPDLLQFPVVKPIHETVHSMYPGCWVAVTLNLYTYMSGSVPGMSAGATTAVFKSDDERFGGGLAVDEEDIFLD